MDIELRQQIEIAFWKNSKEESPEVDSVPNIVNKMSEAGVFLESVAPYRAHFEQAHTILELGGGQGWASCLIKKTFPNKRIIASDISEWAIASIPKWERIFQVKIDQSFACKSYEIPLADASVDLIFVFAAAHHFVAHKRTLREIARILSPRGRCIYLNEPVTPKLFYRPSVWRVNRKRPEVPEDVMISKRIAQLAAEACLSCELNYNLSTRNRGAIETIYYFVQSKLPLLARCLPSSANFIFSKQEPAQIAR